MIKNIFKRPVFCFLAFFLLLLSAVFMAAPLTGVQAQGGVPGGDISNPVVRAVDIAKPSVVRIITNIGGSVTVHITATQSATFPVGGGNYQLEFSGSGAFVTSHGDILTANHVVNPSHDKELDDLLFEKAAKDVADYINHNFTTTTSYTERDAFSLMENGNFPTETHYGQPNSYVYLSTDYSGVLLQTNFKKLGPDFRHYVVKIEQQSASDVHDVAIIHVNMNDTPAIRLGDSSGVEQQDELTIIGFPGNADINTKDDPTDILTSSVNKIYVSALKENAAGSSLIQVGGNVEHGDSGGPALDKNGDIVGIVSSYSSNADYPLGTSFLQTSSYAQGLITIQGLDTTFGPFEKAWRQAFTDYSSTAPGHWHKAQQELQKLSDQYTAFNAVNPYLNYAQDQATHEHLPAPASSLTTYGAWAIAIACFLGLVLIALGWLLFFILRRKKSSVAAPTEMAPAWPQPGFMPTPQANVPVQMDFSPSPVPNTQQGTYWSTSTPPSSPSQNLQSPFPTYNPALPFKERPNSYQFPPTPTPSPVWEIGQKEIDMPTAKQEAILNETVAPDSNEKQ